MHESLSVCASLPNRLFHARGKDGSVSLRRQELCMTIAFPSFDATFCQMVGICSFIGEAAHSSSLPSDDIEIFSSYRTHSGKDGKAFARLVWNPEIKHSHVDVALRAWFGKTPPRAKTNITTFRKTLAQFEGLTVSAHHHGAFVIPLTALPSNGGLIFVGNSGIRLSTGKTEIDLTGATLTFRRSHIRKIRWELIEDKGVSLNIDTKRRDLRVTETYLTEALKLLESAVAAYITRKESQ